MDKTAAELYEMAFSGRQAPALEELLVFPMPEGMFASLDLNKFRTINAAKHAVKNCRVWFPKGYSLHLKSRLVFEINAAVSNCNFYFFRMPSNKAIIKFAIAGRDHTAVSFSTRRLGLYVRMAHQNAYLTLGDAVFIGGARLALDNTTLTVGACGLWSDGVLIQGTDSHGVVDLDSMEIINDGPKHITLGRRVWLGRLSSVMKNVTIGEGSLVATNSVVVKDVPPACAVGGIPARVLKERVSWTHKQSFISEFDKREMLKLKDKLKASSATSEA